MQTDKRLDTKQFAIVDGKLVLKLQGKKWDSTQKSPHFQIPLEDIAYYLSTDEDNIHQINKKVLPKISIQLTDLQEKKLTMTNKIRVTSRNKILSP